MSELRILGLGLLLGLTACGPAEGDACTIDDDCGDAMHCDIAQDASEGECAVTEEEVE